MKITKFGQSCLLIEEADARIILDPGSFSQQQNSLKDIDIVLITHDHQDHLDMESVKAILANNPEVKIFTNAAVHKKLEAEGIASTVVAHGETATEKGITLEGRGELHAVVINSVPQVENVGFLINGKLFYPGDALTVPGKHVEILALPTAGPWVKVSEVVDYALEVKPTIAFPIPDSVLANPAMMQSMFVPVLAKAGIDFRPVELDTVYEF
jgi:L-ascorbate metabolism protein UlaG (beta-lactamase superfamily)